MRYAGPRVLAAVGLGILLGTWLDLRLFLIPTAIGIGLLKASRGWSLYLTLAGLAGLNHHLRQPLPVESIYGRYLSFQGLVVETPSNPRYPRYTIRLEEVRTPRSAYRLTHRLFLDSWIRPPLSYGDLVQFEARVEPLRSLKNPYGFRAEEFYERRGVIGIARPEGIRVLGQGGEWWMRSLILPLRHYFLGVIERWLPRDEAGLLSGLLLGERARLSPELRKAFSDSGVMHVLAVSGLHIGILVAILWVVFKVLRLPPWVSLPLLFISLFLYAGITEFRPSVVRAGLMCGLAGAGMLLGRRVNPLNSVIVAGVFILLLSPQALQEPSFQLSFAATLGILLFYPRLYEWFRGFNPHKLIQRLLLNPISVSISAQLGVSPLLLYHFFRLPLQAVAANLFIVPLVGLAIPLGLLLVLIHPVSHLLASWVSETTWAVTTLILTLTQWFSQAPGLVTPGRPDFWMIGLFWLLVLLAAYLDQPWARRWFRYSALLGFNLFVWLNPSNPNRLEATFLDLPKGDATIHITHGRAHLILAGSPPSQPILDYLRGRGVSSIKELKLFSSPDSSIIEKLRRELRVERTEIHPPEVLGLRIRYGKFSLLELSSPAPVFGSASVLKLPYSPKSDPSRISKELPSTFIFTREAVPNGLLEGLRAQGVQAFDTRTEGAVTVITDGERFSIRSYSSSR